MFSSLKAPHIRGMLAQHFKTVVDARLPLCLWNRFGRFVKIPARYTASIYEELCAIIDRY